MRRRTRTTWERSSSTESPTRSPGGPDGPFNDGFPTLAGDGFDAAIDRFAAICNATERCLFSLDAATVLDDLGVQVRVLPTPDFAGPPDVVDTDAFNELIDDSMTFAGQWELLATALEDADRGDASALASLSAGPPGDDQPGTDADADEESGGESDFSEANFMIYCADLGPLVTDSSFCDDMPENPQPLTPVAEVEVEREILVIGTEFDPLTPGYHAPEFAEALGDATHIIWEGVGPHRVSRLDHLYRRRRRRAVPPSAPCRPTGPGVRSCSGSTTTRPSATSCSGTATSNRRTCSNAGSPINRLPNVSPRS